LICLQIFELLPSPHSFCWRTMTKMMMWCDDDGLDLECGMRAPYHDSLWRWFKVMHMQRIIITRWRWFASLFLWLWLKRLHPLCTSFNLLSLRRLYNILSVQLIGGVPNYCLVPRHATQVDVWVKHTYIIAHASYRYWRTMKRWIA
jgi:hypothetical protein